MTYEPQKSTGQSISGFVLAKFGDCLSGVPVTFNLLFKGGVVKLTLGFQRLFQPIPMRQGLR